MIICVDLRTKAPLLLYFHIFCTCNIIDCPSLDIHIWIYKSIYEHKADFYFNKVPLHAAVFPLFWTEQSILQKLWLFMLSRRLNLCWTTHAVCECFGFPVCFFSCVSCFFFCLWFTLHRRYTVKRLKTCNRSDILGLNLF